LFFYPLDFTFVCPTEIIEFSTRVNEFKDINAEVIGCSNGSKYSKEAWCNLERS
jgi:alkyl hydroperoxide reductase subunit AhpC